MRSIAGSISLVCGFYAMTHYPVSEVLTLTNMFPLWVAVLSLPLLGHWPSADVWPATLVGILGIVLIQSAEGGQFVGGAHRRQRGGALLVHERYRPYRPASAC